MRHRSCQPRTQALTNPLVLRFPVYYTSSTAYVDSCPVAPLWPWPSWARPERAVRRAARAVAPGMHGIARSGSAWYLVRRGERRVLVVPGRAPPCARYQALPLASAAGGSCRAAGRQGGRAAGRADGGQVPAMYVLHLYYTLPSNLPWASPAWQHLHPPVRAHIHAHIYAYTDDVSTPLPARSQKRSGRANVRSAAAAIIPSPPVRLLCSPSSSPPRLGASNPGMPPPPSPQSRAPPPSACPDARRKHASRRLRLAPVGPAGGTRSTFFPAAAKETVGDGGPPRPSGLTGLAWARLQPVLQSAPPDGARREARGRAASTAEDRGPRTESAKCLRK